MALSAVSIKLSDDEKAKWAELAKATKRSAHFHMRAALAQYLEEQDWRRTFVKEAEAAWVHYKETGLHITLEELEAWAENPSQAMPKCHV